MRIKDRLLIIRNIINIGYGPSVGLAIVCEVHLSVISRYIDKSKVC